MVATWPLVGMPLNFSTASIFSANKISAGIVVAYLVVPLNTYQHQNVKVRSDAEKADVKEKLADSM